MNLTVLLSGSGTNFQAILDAISHQQLAGVKVIKVIADRECQGINRAINYQIPHAVVSRKRKDFASTLVSEIPIETDYIILAGFLSIIPASIIEKFTNKIVNIHPALLPKFGGKGMYGMNVHKAVLAAGETESGCTVHLVDVGVDTGQALFQRVVPVFTTDLPSTLQQRVLKQEHQVFPLAIQYLNLLYQAQVPNAELQSGNAVSDQFLAQGITTFQQACHFVKNLPYHRNKRREASCVLDEQRGVCSTKHALLKQLADEVGIGNQVKMMLGVFRMNAQNTPKVAKVLAKYQLDHLPEAHTYLKVNSHLIDLTTSESFTANFTTDLLEETEYQPSQIGDWKVVFHKEFLKQYVSENQFSYSAEELWKIREECIEALFA